MARRRNAEKSEEDVKTLVKISKKTKGMVNIDLLKRLLPMMGWSIEDANVALDGSKKSWDIAKILEKELWPQEHRTRIVYDFDVPKAWAFNAEKNEDAQQLKRNAEAFFTFVKAIPESPRPGAFYATSPSEIQIRNRWYTFSIKKIWLGIQGWVVTTPKGESVAIPAPLQRRGVAAGPAYEIPTFWTFAYKHGLDKDAAAALSPEEIVEASRTKAERERIEMQRSALPEVAAVFREITDKRYKGVVKYLEEMLRAATKKVLEIQNDARIDWEEIPGGTTVQRLLNAKWDYETRSSLWEPKENYEALLVALAKQIADETREAFVIKNTARISEIAKRKESIPMAKLLSIGEGSYGGYGGEISFVFPDGSSFILRNKTIWKTSPLGVVFAQFPTTFHDVKLPDGKKMASPSEARMLDVFAKQSNPRRRRNPSDPPPASPRLRQIASRLANGG